jgi:hypothetical protein
MAVEFIQQIKHVIWNAISARTESGSQRIADAFIWLGQANGQEATSAAFPFFR